MCGIIGMYTAEKQGFYNADREQLKNMLVVTSLRGSHSTGLFGVGKNVKDKDKVSLIKTIGSPFMLSDWKMSDMFFQRMLLEFGTVVGHCRYATMGNISAETAHPFKEGNITLVHNGVINNYLSLKDKQHSHISVDSHLVTALINEEGALEIIPRLRGAYTLVWWDSTDGSLNMARNKERPLFLTKHTKKDHFIFASEKETLDWNAARSGTDCEDVFSLAPFQICKFIAGESEPIITPYKERYVYSAPPYTPHIEVKHHESCKCWKCAQKRDEEAIVPETTKRKIKNRALPMDSDAELSLYLYKESVSIKLGDSVQVDLDDYEDKGQVVMLYGKDTKLPSVEFAVTSTVNNSDPDLIYVDWLEGTVSSIYFVDSSTTVTGQYIKVYLQEVVGCYLEKDGSVKRIHLQGFDKDVKALPPPAKEETDEWVTFKDCDGTDVKIKQHRIHQIADHGCAWCNQKITEYERQHPASLMVYTDSGVDQFVCQDCTEQFSSYATRQARVY